MDAWYEADTRAHLGTCMCDMPPSHPRACDSRGSFSPTFDLQGMLRRSWGWVQASNPSPDGSPFKLRGCSSRTTTHCLPGAALC